MVVDVQCHWYPREFFDTLARRTDYPRCVRVDGGYRTELAPDMSIPVTVEHFDLERQLAESKAVGIDVLVSSTGSTPIDSLPVSEAREVAILLNEARFDMQRKYPDRFVGLATLPMADPEVALATLEDAAGRLGLHGVCICSNVNGESIATEELRPVYARINELGLPVFLHPTRSVMADKLARFGLDFSVGFMFDTTVAALELVFTGLIHELADVPVVHPHFGATIPFLAGRVDYQSFRMFGRTARRASQRVPASVPYGHGFGGAAGSGPSGGRVLRCRQDHVRDRFPVLGLERRSPHRDRQLRRPQTVTRCLAATPAASSGWAATGVQARRRAARHEKRELLRYRSRLPHSSRPPTALATTLDERLTEGEPCLTGPASVYIKDAKFMLTVDPQRRLLDDTSLAVSGDRIAAIGPNAELEKEWVGPADEGDRRSASDSSRRG